MCVCTGALTLARRGVMPEKCSVEFCCVLLRERVKGKVIFREGTKRRADVPRRVNRTLLNYPCLLGRPTAEPDIGQFQTAADGGELRVWECGTYRDREKPVAGCLSCWSGSWKPWSISPNA